MIDNVRIINNSIVGKNPFPPFMQNYSVPPPKDKRYYLRGAYNGQRCQLTFDDDDLTTGLLFLGDAGTGKTNTMLDVANQILYNLEPGDLVVFFDIKGDYRRTFYSEGDFVLSPTNDRYVWNIFDELTPLMDRPYVFNMRVNELCQYLYMGREGNEPYFVNAARAVTACILKYFLYRAAETNDYSRLNNRELLRFIRCDGYGYDDTYDIIRDMLTAYGEFRDSLAYIPPKELGDKSAYGVISEIVNMFTDVFAGAFGATDFGGGEYISAAKFAYGRGAQVIFLEYNPALTASQSYVFRYFVDNIIASRTDCFIDGKAHAVSNEHSGKHPLGCKIGKTYIFLDEFARLPKLEYLSMALNLLRGYGVCVIGGLQDVGQIYMSYKPHEASVILSSFQSVVAFRCGEQSIKYLQGRTGTVFVSDTYQNPGGSIAYSPPHDRPVITDRDVLDLEVGRAIVKHVDHPPFIFRFSKTKTV